jgi:hypothetical protein
MDNGRNDQERSVNKELRNFKRKGKISLNLLSRFLPSFLKRRSYDKGKQVISVWFRTEHVNFAYCK